MPDLKDFKDPLEHLVSMDIQALLDCLENPERQIRIDGNTRY